MPEPSSANPSDKRSLAVGIVKRLTDNGYRALFAGGWVRDMLLGMTTDGDIDIATNATPTTIEALFDRTVGVGEQFGVMIVVRQGIPFEVATFRSDIGIADGRHPASVVFSDERADAQRRDFTINGMFYDPLTDTVLDYVGGREDLDKGVIRAIGEPGQRISEDYLRMLRAIRFASRFGYTIEDSTFRALRENASRIHAVSPERIFQELDKMLCGPHPDLAVALLHECGLLREVLPEVAAMDGVEQPPQFHPEGDVLRHTILALSLLKSPSRCLAWSTLLHDVGKPPTMRVADRIRFNNHPAVGAEMSRAILLRLRAPRALIDCVDACVGNHMSFMNVKRMRLSTLKRLLSRPTFDDELELHRVDCLASHQMVDNYEFLVQKRDELRREVLKPDPLLRGGDLIHLGFKPGPMFGQILREAYDQQLEERVRTRDEALAWVEHAYGTKRTGRTRR